MPAVVGRSLSTDGMIPTDDRTAVLNTLCIATCEQQAELPETAYIPSSSEIAGMPALCAAASTSIEPGLVRCSSGIMRPRPRPRPPRPPPRDLGPGGLPRGRPARFGITCHGFINNRHLLYPWHRNSVLSCSLYQPGVREQSWLMSLLCRFLDVQHAAVSQHPGNERSHRRRGVGHGRGRGPAARPAASAPAPGAAPGRRPPPQ